ARVGEFSQTKLSIRFTRAAADEGQFAVARPVRVPLEKMIDLRGLAILVNAKETDIEIITGILEVIRVAAKKSHLLLGREDEPDVVVTFVSIQVVSAALVKGNDIGSQPGFLFAFFFNRSDHSVARTGSLVAGHAWVDRAVYARSHILNRHQDVELEIGRFEFIGLRF